VAFTKVLIMSQIYHPSSVPPLILGVVLTGIIFAFIYMYTHFIAMYPPSSPLSSTPPPSHWCQPSPLGRTCSALLFSDFVVEKREKIKQKKSHDILA
jgi:hypothetical protein